MDRKRTAILISGRGSNMTALIEAAQGRDLSRAKSCWWSRTVPTPAACSARRMPASQPRWSTTRVYGKDREGFERALQDVLVQHRIEIVCLAGFMRLLTAWFVSRNGRTGC